MAVGPKDMIDQLLVKKYASEKVNNHEQIKMVDAGKMMDAMTDYATMRRNMLALNNKLVLACSALNAKSVKYRQSKSCA